MEDSLRKAGTEGIRAALLETLANVDAEEDLLAGMRELDGRGAWKGGGGDLGVARGFSCK